MHACIGEGNGNPLQCSCLENPRDGGAWWAAVYGVTQSRTQLKQLSSSISSCRQTETYTISLPGSQAFMLRLELAHLAPLGLQLLTVQIFWQRTGKAVKWDLLTVSLSLW